MCLEKPALFHINRVLAGFECAKASHHCLLGSEFLVVHDHNFAVSSGEACLTDRFDFCFRCIIEIHAQCPPENGSVAWSTRPLRESSHAFSCATYSSRVGL